MFVDQRRAGWPEPADRRSVSERSARGRQRGATRRAGGARAADQRAAGTLHTL